MPDHPPNGPDRADEFYVGYLPVPRGQRLFMRFIVPAILWLMVGTASLIAAWMRDAGPAVWDASTRRVFDGRLEVRPYPVLRLAAEAGGAGGGPASYLLVEAGKLGGRAGLEGLDGRMVRAAGSLLERDGRRMIELAPGEGAVVAGAGADAPGPAKTPLGHVALRGEIVDAKCYLGAMRPGDGKTHRGCAQLCIAGGVPPMLVTRGAAGEPGYFVLVAPDGGKANGLVRPYVAEPVEVTGDLERVDDLVILRLDPEGIRRL